MDGLDFQLKHHKIFLKQRSIERIIQSPLFQVAWDQANKKKRKKVARYIYHLDIRGLQFWLFDDFENHSVRELRQLASHNHILNYCQLSKAELISILLKKGIKDGRDRKIIKRNETISSGIKCT